MLEYFSNDPFIVPPPPADREWIEIEDSSSAPSSGKAKDVNSAYLFFYRIIYNYVLQYLV